MAANMKTLEEEKQFVEELGISIEKLGAPPLQSRVISLLIMRTPEGVPFDEIVEFLGASKSSVSSALNLFLQLKHVVYYTKPGDRKRYFKVPFSSFWLSDFENKIKDIDSIISILVKLSIFRGDENSELQKNLSNSKLLLKRIQTLALQEIEKFKDELKMD